MKQSDILIFANPISGMGRGLRIAEELVVAASAAGMRATVCTQHPCTLPAALLASASDVVIVGGDGTLRCVVDRLIELCPQPMPLPEVALVPLGTANLMAHHLGCMWPRGTGGMRGPIGPQVLRAIVAGRRRRIDLASANGKVMLSVAGAGFDAKVVHELAAVRKGPITYADWVLPTVRSLLAYKFAPLSVALDGRAVLSDTPAIAFIGNIPEYGTGFSVTPAAKPDDGLLDVCILPCASWQQVIELGVLCGSQLQVSSDRTIYRRARKVEITSAAQVPVQVDGDAAGFTPLTVDLLPRQLTFIVPAP